MERDTNSTNRRLEGMETTSVSQVAGRRRMKTVGEKRCEHLLFVDESVLCSAIEASSEK